MSTKTKVLTTIALSVAINIVGSKISLFLSLPIFLDSIGTILAGATLGPIAGLVTALVGGLVNGVLGDIYSIYFAPSGMIMGLLAGVVLYHKKVTKLSVIWKTALISVPASFVSALISTYVFGGITSALLTTTIIQGLSKTVMDLFTSAFVTQTLTDYVDKLIAVVLTLVIIKRIPRGMLYFADNKQ
ncbi:MAG: ECF transporter S component [Bacilli bacterium]|nr:ECF transporter S component [Bacilli bacterium]